MNLAELSPDLGLSTLQLKIRIRRGELNATKQGSRWFIHPEEVKRYKV